MVSKRARLAVINAHDARKENKRDLTPPPRQRHGGVRYVKHHGPGDAIHAFMRRTPAHGFGALLQGKSTAGRIFWMLCTLLFYVFGIVALGMVISRYREYLYRQNISVRNTAVDFPTVTICNINPARVSQRHLGGAQFEAEVAELESNVQSKFQSQEYVDAVSSLKAGVTSPLHVGRESFAIALSKLNASEKVAMGHQLEDMVVSCTFADEDCDLDKLLLNVEEGEYSQWLHDGTALRVAVHERGSMPQPDVAGVVVSPSSQLTVRLTTTSFERLGSPYRAADCATENHFTATTFTENFGFDYTKSSEIEYGCGCYDARLQPTLASHPCEEQNREDLSCMMARTSEYEKGQSSCNCVDECRLASVEVHFMDVAQTQVKEVPVMEVPEALAQVGGMLRFFTGSTLLTGVEMATLFVNVFGLVCSSGSYVSVD
ncbi:PREDICTED: FMRFamide-activated amiloride-sensitive sodium channel-like [Priapulus caudatus]|uniref:FMRFamide-activated amiloride-sensitive sodium channel-like n=1 Tax=Priapulus caudatus TaxID=37621 RepID=A0ABM1DZ14_PRICU|nr:PREDICTED: FMRFamide-activated amiloride-sensitive sodium channel-like [Priapulus caudatus]